MKALLAAACLATCCMGNLPVPGGCHGQLLNDQNPSFYLQGANDHGNTASGNARWCGDRA